MVKARGVSDEALSVSMLLEIDKICREFEAALKAGKEPQIEAFLGDTSEPHRSQLRSELETIQREHGQQSEQRVTLAQFIQNLVSSGVMTEDQVQTVLNDLSTDERPETADQFAKLLHRHGHLTSFQARAIYQGKTRGLVLGNYVILDKLGRGGMGQVFKAQHRRMERVVALKMLPTAAMRSPEAVKRFQREAKAAAKLSHMNIVTAHDADEADGIHFLVMECVDGQDLASLVKQQGPLDAARAVDYTLQAAVGLEYAHQHGIVHRDIKPANILLSNDGAIKILDMGLARIEGAKTNDDALTATGQVMGTLDFMSPEQALDTRNVDGRTDVYSLGCTLFYLLTGQAPYDGDTMTKKILAHREEPIPSLRDACPDVPESLDTIYQTMLLKDPADRQASMAEVIEQLTACDVTPQSGPPPLPQKQGFVEDTLSATADSVDDTSALEPPDISLDRSIVTPNEAVAPNRVADRHERPRSSIRSLSDVPWIVPAIAVGVLGIALILVILFIFRREHQTVQVEIDSALLDDATVTVKLDGKELEIAGLGETIKLKPGEHSYEIYRGDEKIVAREFTVLKGNNPALRISIEMDQGGTAPGPGEFEPGFVSLFDGATLDGWDGDSRLWRVVDGTIVGDTTSVDFDLHSYLRTKTTYRDFIFKAKFRLHEGNSGIQFRSESLANHVVAGYQAEIAWPALHDPSEDTVLGLFFQGVNRKGIETDRRQLLRHFKEKDWNEYVITCQGPHIKIELNGHTTVDFIEDQPARDEGVIGFQIMRRPATGIRDMKVELKDIRIKDFGTASSVGSPSATRTPRKPGLDADGFFVVDGRRRFPIGMWVGGPSDEVKLRNGLDLAVVGHWAPDRALELGPRKTVMLLVQTDGKDKKPNWARKVDMIASRQHVLMCWCGFDLKQLGMAEREFADGGLNLPLMFGCKNGLADCISREHFPDVLYVYATVFLESGKAPSESVTLRTNVLERPPGVAFVGCVGVPRPNGELARAANTLRCNAHLMTAVGSTAVMFVGWEGLTEQSTAWNDVKELVKELRSLERFLLSPSIGSLQANNVCYGSRICGDEVLLIACNPSEKTVDDDVPLPLNIARGEQIEVIGEKRSVRAVDGKIHDQFDPVGVHLYRYKCVLP